MSKTLNYISLFSSAGVGCFGFKEEGFQCIATNELLEKRLNIQKINKKCQSDDGYILGDIRNEEVKKKLYNQIENKDINVLIATPPCQGISVANHKKNNETDRNSLVLQSIEITKNVSPDIFIFENVRGFLGTKCKDFNGEMIGIEQAIEKHLGGLYNIASKVVNFKEYGVPSSRTRTIVIGTLKKLMHFSPYLLFPDNQKEIPLKEAIGHYPSLKEMGEIDPNDIYHNFRSYDKRMLPWIANTKMGSSAFDNNKKEHRPHRIIDGEYVPNKNKNGDKYSRCSLEKVGPCIHTRNDILSSQSTIHPIDNRVFSIRELMVMMGIPKNFKWAKGENKINNADIEEKKSFIKNNDINIRQSIGEAVPTVIFQKIAKNIVRSYEVMKTLKDKKK